MQQALRGDAKRRVWAGAIVVALIAGGLTGIFAAKSASATTVNSTTVNCSTAATNYTLGTALQAGDTLNVNFINCNQYSISWTDASFTSTSPVTVNGNNTQTLALTASGGFAAATAATLVTLTQSGGGTPKVFRVTQGSAPSPVTKVTICHRTRATTNPYVMITVSVNSVIGSGGSNGHDDHNTTRTNKTNPTTNGISPGSGPFDTAFSYPSNQKWWGDIIPPFAYAGGFYSGLNWGPTWTTPDPTGDTSDWLQPSEFAAAVTETTSVYGLAVQQCMGIPSGTQSAKSAQIDSPQKYFDAAVASGEDPAAVREDLVEQQALSMGDATPTSGAITIPEVTTLETNYSSTAKVTTEPATSVTTTTAQVNGILKTGETWDSWQFQWATSSAAVTDGTGSSHTYTPGTDPSASIGAGPTTPLFVVTGLTCGTTYYFRVVGTYSVSTTAYGLIRTFTTASCGGGGGGGGGGAPAPEPTAPMPSPTSTGTPTVEPTQATVREQTTLGPETLPTAAPSSGQGTVASGDGRVTLTPTRVFTPPVGTTWRPEATRLVIPGSTRPVETVRTNAGSWRVNPTTGAVTFKPAPNFIGTARVRVRLSGRNGQTYIRPMDFRVNAKSRVRVLAGDVPTSIHGGL